MCLEWKKLHVLTVFSSINSQKNFQDLDSFDCYIRSVQGRDGKECLQLKFHVFLRYSFFFPDPWASENASFIADILMPLFSVRCLPPKGLNSEDKLNQIGMNHLPTNQLLFKISSFSQASLLINVLTTQNSNKCCSELFMICLIFSDTALMENQTSVFGEMAMWFSSG